MPLGSRAALGRPPGRQSGADHVLRRPSRAEAAELGVVVAEAVAAGEPEAARSAMTAICTEVLHATSD